MKKFKGISTFPLESYHQGIIFQIIKHIGVLFCFVFLNPQPRVCPLILEKERERERVGERERKREV